MGRGLTQCVGVEYAPSTIQIGTVAETLAAEYLQRQGLCLLERNLRCRAGELDLVCLDGEVLVIVEVRRRARSDFGGAVASITWRKRRTLLRATRYFWQRRTAWQSRMLRFDVLALQGRPDGTLDVEWIKDAFRGAI